MNGGERIFKQAKLLVERYAREHKSNGLVVPVGSAHITTGGTLCEYVIHAVGTDMSGVNSNLRIVEDATLSSLVVADKNKIKSIAFPLLGTGFGGLDRKDVAKVMLETVDKFVSDSKKSLEEVFVYIYDRIDDPLITFFTMLGFNKRNCNCLAPPIVS